MAPKKLSLRRERYRRVRSSSRALALSTALLLSPYALHAQGITANLSGTVTDQSGAVIPNANISLKNQATGDIRTGKSNGAGDFTFSSVEVGNYEIDVQASGFQQFKEAGIHLDPGDQRSLHELKMVAGSEATNVTVHQADQSITLDSGEQSSLISAEDIKRLSVEGRDVTELLKVLPGFAIGNPSGGLNTAYDPSQVQVTGAIGSYDGDGNNITGTALLSDGVDITDPGDFGDAIQNINYAQVAEVKVQTSSFAANEARGPIVINAISKSGGDHFHGSLYTFARTNQLDSTDWLSNYTNQLKPPDREVYPGFTLGGPIYVPHLDFNKDKRLTFFVGAEDYAQRNEYAYGSAGSAIVSALVPTAAMRTGDFSQTQLQQYLGNELTNASYANINTVPVTGKNGAALTNGQLGTNLDAETPLLADTLPLPNMTSANGFNYRITNLVDDDLWQAKGRIDYAINDKNKLFVQYSKEAGKKGVPEDEYYAPSGDLGGADVPGGGLLSTINSEIGSLHYTSIISPTLTNNVYVAGAWLLQNFVPKNFAATTLNGAYTYGGLFNNGSKEIPEFMDYNYDGLPVVLSPDGSFGGIYAKKWIRTGGDDLTKVLGKHTVSIGFFTQLDTNHQVPPSVDTDGAVELYYFPESFVDPVAGNVHWTGAVGSGSGGNYLANFLEGGVQTFTQTNSAPAANVYFWNIDGYIQDHWRITPHLTIDYGVRFDHLSPWSDAHKQGIPVWNPAAYASRSNPALPGVEWHAIDPSVPLSGVPAKWAYTEPRVGFAWDAYGTGQTIVRGGFGIYRAHDSYNDVTPGISTVEGQRSATVQNILLSSVSSQQSQFINPSGFVPDTSVSALEKGDDQIPQTFTYNVAVDQKAFASSIFEIAYIGNRTEHLLNDGSSNPVELNNINAIRPGGLFGPNPLTGVTLPLLAPTGSVNETNIANSVTNLSANEIDQYRPFPLYHTISVSQHNAYSNYNSLQMQWNKQQGKLFYGVNYTFSKVLGILGGGPEGKGNGLPVDPFNYRDSYEPLNFDHTHIFNATYSYQFGNLVHNRYVGLATNGWELSGITDIQSGGDLVSQSPGSANFNLAGNLAVLNQTGQPTTLGVTAQNFLGTPDELLQPVISCNPGIHMLSHQYVNGNCFSLPQLGQQGTLRPPYIHQPAFTDTDLTLAKDFAAGEGRDVQFRLAGFNFINHANTSFATSVQPSALTLNYNNGSSTAANAVPVTSAIATAPETNAPGFGLAPLRTGRRIVELSVNVNF